MLYLIKPISFLIIEKGYDFRVSPDDEVGGGGMTKSFFTQLAENVRSHSRYRPEKTFAFTVSARIAELT